MTRRLPDPPDSDKITIAVDFPEDLYAKLAAMAESEGMEIGEYIRYTIRTDLHRAVLRREAGMNDAPSA